MLILIAITSLASMVTLLGYTSLNTMTCHAHCVWYERRPSIYALHDTRLPVLIHAAVMNAFSLLTAVVFHDAARTR